jgi:hypothetical protein
VQAMTTKCCVRSETRRSCFPSSAVACFPIRRPWRGPAYWNDGRSPLS